MITLEKEVLDRISEHATAEYPKECCGILIGSPGGDGLSVHPCTNIQDRLRQEDPITYPRDARTAYYIDPSEQFRIISEAEARERVVWGFYHSHPDHSAYFSAEDATRALLDGEPIYPGATYIVVSIIKRTVCDVKAYAYNEQAQSFQEHTIERRNE
ncbi:MAG: M67 family metallopeptidase [Candidatus Latescibacteria bacterium]|nr:M67 family metallopeptidase [Candidatus Latescibacterota bacterium]